MNEPTVTISKQEYGDLRKDHQTLLKLIVAIKDITQEWDGVNTDSTNDAKERGVPCDNKFCKFYDGSFEQHCSGESNGEPALVDCSLYDPVI